MRKQLPRRKGRVCTICSHPDRARIEATRINGVSLDATAKKFSISRDALHRHFVNHVTDDVKSQLLADVPIKELAARASAEGVSLIDYFCILRATLLQQFQLAASCNVEATLAFRK
jgi:hypothetical protein